MNKLLTILLFISYSSFSQTGIGTTTPDTSAKLEVRSTNKGFLPPRVTLTSVTDATTILSPATGLLVYNNGSVGLQAGYYYWNGTSWSTIATSTIAGSGVVASDLVKLYQEAYSTTAGKASSTDGYSFTVPVSGRYEFNFNCTGWNSNGATVKLTFNVRQGTTVLASDYHQSISSNIWAEYEGRVEVNLNAGTIYNVQVVTTTGYRDYRDWDKIMYKQVAGNLPVNVYPWVLSGNDVYNTSGNVGIGNNAPTSKLDVTGDLKVSGASTTNYLTIGTGTGDEGGEFSLARAQTNQSLGGNINVDVYRNNLRIFEGGGSNRGVSLDLSKAPNAVGGELLWKVSGLVNAGTFLSMDNLKVSVTTGGSRGLSVGAVSTNFTANISAYYSMNGGVAGSAAANIAYTTTPSGAAFGWSFPSEGDGSYYNILDKTNNRMYRVTLIIGASYLNNFICIERLF
jgi:hypothetical protein